MARQRTSYFWALHAKTGGKVPINQLSDDAFDALDYARQLALDAKARQRQNISPEEGFPPLTIEDIAEVRHISPTTVDWRIAAARRELFGDISDNAIHRRLARNRKRDQRAARPCSEPGCSEQLGAHTHGNREYCDDHASASEHVRRHRHRQRPS